MKKIEQPTATVSFRLPNGVKLRVEAYARAVKSSDRIDARTIAIDWDSISTTLCLDVDAYISLINLWLDDEDAISYLDEEALAVAVSLGSPDYAETIKNAFYHARAKILEQKGE
jgi:hypothetical protein